MKTHTRKEKMGKILTFKPIANFLSFIQNGRMELVLIQHTMQTQYSYKRTNTFKIVLTETIPYIIIIYNINLSELK